jgi:transcriptional regulator with XRE-family HTH domain
VLPIILDDSRKPCSHGLHLNVGRYGPLGVLGRQAKATAVSSRTYLSSLEQGMKSPTISKVEELASVMGTPPLSLLALAYPPEDLEGRKLLCGRVQAEILTFDVNLSTGAKLESISCCSRIFGIP